MEDDDLRFLVFDLLPLSERDAAEIVEIATDAEPLRPHEVEELAQRSGGSPLFLVELLNLARSAGTVEALPESVEAVVTADIDRLAPSDRIVLRYASVLGVNFDEALLRSTLRDEVGARPDTVERLRGLVERGADGRLRFRNTLVHDAAYEGLPFRRRRELHERVGMVIESRPGDEAGVLSLHFFHAGDFERAWRYSRLAGDHAKRIYANVDAASLYERALSAARRYRGAAEPDVAGVAESLGDVRYRLGEFEAAGEAYRTSRRHLPADPVEEARLMLKHALGPWRLGRYPQALGWLTRGIRVIEGHEEQEEVRERARLYAWKGVIKLKQGHPLEAIEWCRRAIAAAEASGARDALAQALYQLDWAYLALGRFDEVVHSQRALAIYEELGDLSGRGRSSTTWASSPTARGAGSSRSIFTTGAAGLGAGGRPLVGRVRRREPGRGPPRPGAAGRGGAADEGVAANRESLQVRLPNRRDGALLRHAPGRPDGSTSAAAARRSARGVERSGERGEVLVTEARIAESLVFQGAAGDALELVEGTLSRAGDFEGIFVLVPTLERSTAKP